MYCEGGTECPGGMCFAEGTNCEGIMDCTCGMDFAEGMDCANVMDSVDSANIIICESGVRLCEWYELRGWYGCVSGMNNVDDVNSVHDMDSSLCGWKELWLWYGLCEPYRHCELHAMHCVVVIDRVDGTDCVNVTDGARSNYCEDGADYVESVDCAEFLQHNNSILDEIERDSIVGLREAGWTFRCIARHFNHSAYNVKSSRQPWWTTSRDDRFIMKQAVITSWVSLHRFGDMLQQPGICLCPPVPYPTGQHSGIHPVQRRDTRIILERRTMSYKRIHPRSLETEKVAQGRDDGEEMGRNRFRPPAFAWSDFEKPWKTEIRMAGPEPPGCKPHDVARLCYTCDETVTMHTHCWFSINAQQTRQLQLRPFALSRLPTCEEFRGHSSEEEWVWQSHGRGSFTSHISVVHLCCEPYAHVHSWCKPYDGGATVSAGFLEGLPFTPPLYTCAAPYSARFTLISPHDQISSLTTDLATTDLLIGCAKVMAQYDPELLWCLVEAMPLIDIVTRAKKATLGN
ncbi:hypothetical protein PR048_025714 [Dryococelus australis]|uniref:EGF-like domain-containing protein n=1 Tax=Dryococelus australis TaxID=614101 RepID=A0ABQ9GJC5_9NEOP|nr:hypothetical protein PR048_025714 [Dryococelus australis]